METKKVGIYDVTIHPFQEVKRTEIPRNTDSVVDWNFRYLTSQIERPTLVLQPKFRSSTPEDDLKPGETVLDGKPEYGLGKTLREHEESHINDYQTILRERQPNMSFTDEGYRKYMQDTNDLLKVCSDYHTDQVGTRESPHWNECARILNIPDR